MKMSMSDSSSAATAIFVGGCCPPSDICTRLAWNYEEVLDHAGRRTAILTDMSKHLAKLVEIYDDTAKLLAKSSQKWYTSVPAHIEGEFSSTAANSVNGLVTSESLIQKRYASFCEEVRKNVIQPLNDFITSAENELKRIQGDYSHIMKQYSEAGSNVSKLRSKYLKACIAREKGSSSGGSLESIEQQYRSSIGAYNRFHTLLFSQAVNGCHTLLSVLYERDKLLQRSLRTLSSCGKGIMPDEALTELARSADGIYTDADYDCFSAILELSCHPPHSLFFEQFLSSSDGGLPPSSPSSQDAGANGNGIPRNWKPTEIALLRMPLEALVIMQQSFGRDGPSTLPYGLKWLLDTICELSSNEHGDESHDLALRTVPHGELFEVIEGFGRGDFSTPKSTVVACEILRVFLRSLPEGIIPESLCSNVIQQTIEPNQFISSIPEPNRSTFCCIMNTLQALSRLPFNSPESVADGFALSCFRAPQMKNDYSSLKKLAFSGRRFFVRLLNEIDFSAYGQLLKGTVTEASVVSIASEDQHSSSANSWTKSSPSTQRGPRESLSAQVDFFGFSLGRAPPTPTTPASNTVSLSDSLPKTPLPENPVTVESSSPSEKSPRQRPPGISVPPIPPSNPPPNPPPPKSPGSTTPIPAHPKTPLPSTPPPKSPGSAAPLANNPPPKPPTTALPKPPPHRVPPTKPPEKPAPPSRKPPSAPRPSGPPNKPLPKSNPPVPSAPDDA